MHFYLKIQQEAQLPQRNSASAAHMEGVGLDPQPVPSPPPLATPMRMAESESHNVRTGWSKKTVPQF